MTSQVGTGEPLLGIAGLSKSFAGVRALENVSFDLRRGEIHALVGENGAGKSTLIKVITGAHSPDQGTLTFDGKAVGALDPQAARGLGITAVYQQPALFPDLTVAENIRLGRGQGGPWQRVDRARAREEARALLGRIGARIDAEAVVGSLRMPEQQMVEIARALGAQARLLILDEPTASLSDQEVDHLLRILRDLRRDGVGIVYISHRMEELFTLADRVTVLRDGRTVATRAMAEVDRAELIRLMVGRELSAIFPKKTVPVGDVVLEARGLGCRASGVHDVSLALHAGEIVGLAGLVGSGRTELARVLFGLTPADSGEMRVRGEPVTIDSPARAVETGLAYVPEDRRRHGVILEMPVRENATLAILRTLSKGAFLDFARERRLASDFVEQLGIKTASVDSAAGTLSGGNQQKVALARWLATRPAVIVLDEPTQGIDVGAKAEIHRLMGDLAEQGLAVLMISSDMPEVLGLSDRVAVMHDGTLAGVLERAAATQESILALALGGRETPLPTGANAS